MTYFNNAKGIDVRCSSCCNIAPGALNYSALSCYVQRIRPREHSMRFAIVLATLRSSQQFNHWMKAIAFNRQFSSLFPGVHGWKDFVRKPTDETLLKIAFSPIKMLLVILCVRATSVGQCRLDPLTSLSETGEILARFHVTELNWIVKVQFGWVRYYAVASVQLKSDFPLTSAPNSQF